MGKSIVFLVVALLFAAPSWGRMNVAMMAGGPAAGCTVTETPETSCSDTIDNDCDGLTDGADSDCASGAILDYDDEAYADGTLLTAAGWAGTAHASLAISDDMAATGTKSIMIDTEDHISRDVTKTFTAQSSTFTISFDFAYVGSSHADYFFTVSSGATDVFYWYFAGSTLQISDVEDLISTSVSLTASTFYTISIEINPAADTYKVSIDGTPVLSGTVRTFQNSVTSVDTIKLSTYQDSSSTTAILYIDDLLVEEGGW